MPPERVELLTTCIVDAVSPRLGRAAAAVLERLGYEVVIPKTATCCGQPAWNSGFAREAAAVAATTLEAFGRDPDTAVCIPAGSCATMMKVYWPELFRLVDAPDQRDAAEALVPRIAEFSELVTAAGLPSGRYPKTVAYHKSCHMLRELEIDDGPAAILRGLDGCELTEWRDDLCCGFGGTFSVKEPELSVAMADAKIESLLDGEPDELIGCDRSCLMHLESRMRRRGIDLPVRHLAEVLADVLGVAV